MNLFAALALASLAAPAPKEVPAKPDQEAIQGEWRVTSFLKDGCDGAKEEKDGKVVIKGSNFTIKARDWEQPLTFTLDPKADTKAIDLQAKKEGKDVTLKGIYKLEKDKLTICFGMLGEDRPKEFKSEAGGRTGLIVLQRVTK